MNNKNYCIHIHQTNQFHSLRAQSGNPHFQGHILRPRDAGTKLKSNPCPLELCTQLFKLFCSCIFNNNIIKTNGFDESLTPMCHIQPLAAARLMVIEVHVHLKVFQGRWQILYVSVIVHAKSQSRECERKCTIS